MNRPQVAYFLSGVLAYFPSGAPMADPRMHIPFDATLIASLVGAISRAPHRPTPA
jgi:hypothetical protein